MASGHKTGCRQKGTPNKRKLSAMRIRKGSRTGDRRSISPEIASMMLLDIMLLAMWLDVESVQWRSAASIAEKTAPYLHAKMAQRSEDGECRPRNHDQHPGLPD
jgi:hypothetical protein